MDLLKIAEKHIEPFQLNEKERKLYENINLYFNRRKSDLDLTKGIGLIGTIGVGKTVIFKLVQYSREYNLRIIKTTDLERDFLHHEHKHNKSELVIDDLGEENKANTYGKDEDVIRLFLSRRYELWKSNGIRTHFTTNNTAESLKNKYSERLWDRLMEMCQPIVYPSVDSKRGLSILKPLQNDFIEIKKDMTDEIKEMLNYHFEKSLEIKENDFKRSCEELGTSYEDVASSAYNDFYRKFDEQTKDEISELRKKIYKKMVVKYPDKIHTDKFKEFSTFKNPENEYHKEWVKLCRVASFEIILNKAIEKQEGIML